MSKEKSPEKSTGKDYSGLTKKYQGISDNIMQEDNC